MTVQPVYLQAEDALELGELLGFLGRWLAGDGERLGASISRFAGNDTYGINDLREDILRFAFMLGDDDLLIGRRER
jgi:hypothetical protein